jgi:hypothetical protein
MKHLTKNLWVWIPLGIAAGVAGLALLGVVIQFLWNATIAAFAWTEPITFWQALLLFVLVKILFHDFVSVRHPRNGS